MDEAESAAMLCDAWVLVDQAKTILKHLRCKFKSQIIAPLKKNPQQLKGSLYQELRSLDNMPKV